jgi:ribonuclease toxin BrnT of type II toxin-antitoxin system
VIEAYDVDQSAGEDRFIVMGRSDRNRVIVTAFTVRGMTIRVISAREARRQERSNMKNKSVDEDDPLDRDIDFSNARPNRFWLGVVDRRCVRLIDKDLADLFPDN